ncbi:MAG: TrmH family RNA methyltransferase [Treponema sp.]|jgi:TrmH family RNA methyltransferase|nr:TrmH family RNA methyltransferase [Treponema sp.]
MIPLYKLEKFPPSLRLRKIVKIFGEAEYRLSLGIDLSTEDYRYLVHILELLTPDPGFAPGITQAINDAYRTLKTGSPLQGQDLSCVLNTIRHFLLAETGQAPADWDFIDHTGRLDPEKRCCFPGMRVYLEDIRSPFNVGAIFRTAESFGVETIFLSPWCADPNHPRAARTAMGCVSILAWERLSPDKGLESTFSCEGPCFALETGGIELGDFTFPLQGTLIVGSEELGVSPQALAVADASLGRVSIPTYGTKGSLNASVAFGIALQSWAAVLAKVCYPCP